MSAKDAANVVKNFMPRVPRAQLVGYLKAVEPDKALRFLVDLMEELEDGSQKAADEG